MEFDSGGNDVRIRTGKTLGLGKAPLIGVRRDSNVSSDKNQKPIYSFERETIKRIQWRAIQTALLPVYDVK